jgi:hypothetical protein
MSDARSLFHRALGDAFSSLPLALQTIHDDSARKVWSGRCDIEQGRGLLIRLMGAIASLPPTGRDVPVSVEIAANAVSETWTRNFGGHVMRSTLKLHNGLLSERLGPVALRFELCNEQGAIEWRLRAVRYLGLPLPTRFFAGICARETLADNRYTFYVHVSLPLLGLLIRYQGWLAEHA